MHPLTTGAVHSRLPSTLTAAMALHLVPPLPLPCLTGEFTVCGLDYACDDKWTIPAVVEPLKEIQLIPQLRPKPKSPSPSPVSRDCTAGRPAWSAS